MSRTPGTAGIRTISAADAPLEPLSGTTVAILGFGNQGSAHARNLRDSGVKVRVGARPGQGLEAARGHGFETFSLEEACDSAGLVIVSLPDEAHAEAWPRVAPRLANGSVVGFLHGFSIRFGLVTPEPRLGVVMVAPKGPGTTLRERFERGQGIPALFAIHQGGADPARTRALGLAWANGIGSARAAIVETTFGAEAESDLFGEQAVLCGGMSALVEAAFETLVEAGYPPELAYIECCHEVKQIADLIYLHGPAGMRDRISTTAEFGALRAAPQLVDDAMRARLKNMLTQIRDGSFARAMTQDAAAGFPWLSRARAAAKDHALEKAGEHVRALIPWLRTERS